MESGPQSLADFIAKTAQSGTLRVEESYGGGFVRLRVDEAERRQAKHDIRSVEDAVIELLRNARDAGARMILLAVSKSEAGRRLVVVDDGSGVPHDMQERIFDARVTSKLDSMHMDAWGVHGRGMALFSIRENAEEARIIASGPGLGTSIAVRFDTAKIPEKADQSTWPELEKAEDGTAGIARGPHNICRTCCEFALEGHGACEVYLGSSAETIAAARRHVRIPKDVRESLFRTSLEELPLLYRLRLAADASELAEVAASLGLDISERTAQRIISGEIGPAQGAWEWCSGKKVQAPRTSARRAPDLSRDSRGLRLSEEDAERFRGMLARDFGYLEQRYYLELAGPPEVRISSGKIQVSFNFAEED